MKFRLLFIICFVGISTIAYSQEDPPNPSDQLNWVSSISYDISGQTLSKGVSFYNSLGKPTQTQSWDALTGKVWGAQTFYDYHGRPALQTLSAPINNTGFFGFENQFILNNSGNSYTGSDFDLYSNVDDPRWVSPNSKLGTFFWNYTDQTSYEYQDNTKYPFYRTVYSKLNPGSVKKDLGGNKINNDWLQSFSFQMPAGQALSSPRAFGNTATEYDDMKVTKMVMRDVHGVESVVFQDSDGNILAVARSGNEENSISPITNNIKIKEQGFVDIHIPVGCDVNSNDITISNSQNIPLKIYNLVDESFVSYATSGNYDLSAGFYRIAVRYPETYLYNPQQAISITHQVNYYDYSLNYFDKSGRLLKSVQPNGYNASSFNSVFSYNSLGQLQTTTSPDEGTAKFIYRKDGQIRFSQNNKQQENEEFSYTNYDRLGRPIESGVYRSENTPFYLSQEVEDVPDPLPVLPQNVTAIHIYNVVTSNTSFGTTYEKINVQGEWNGGFYSQETLEENGYVTFKFGMAGQIDLFGDYDVLVGLSKPTEAEPAVYTNIKYAIGLHSDTNPGNQDIRIYQNGDYIRNGNNNIMSFGTFNSQDTFKVKRANGVITYEKNDIIFYTTADNFLEPLVVDTSFRYATNRVNTILLLNEPVVLPENNVIDIQGLVDVPDGLSDQNCYEQLFTLYDIPDKELNKFMGECGLPEKAYKQTFLSGNVSKTYTINPQTTITWYSYDVYGRVKWLIQQIDGLKCLKTIDYTYDPVTGQVIKVDYQRNMPEERFIHKYEYNIGGQLVRASTSLDDIYYLEQAEYKYNEAGQLKRTEIAENLQGIDYIYNLNGQLKAINHPSLNPTNDPGHDGSGNGFVSDVFGLTLQHYNQDYTRTQTPTPITQIATSFADQFNGNIQALQWQTQNGQHSTYAFDYNKNNWLKTAQFTNPTVDNSEDYKVDNITYDANGNIETLKRNGFTDANGTNAMDDFSYHYKSGKNQLTHVSDTGDNSDPLRYNDLKNQESNNYIYNSIGQLVINKQDKMLYEYNASGLVTKINETSEKNTDSYYTLFSEDFNDLVTYRGSGTLPFTITSGFLRLVKAHQDDQDDNFGDSGELIPIGVDPNNVMLPDYCLDFDDENDNYENRLQFNFYSNTQSSPNPFKIETNFEVVKDAFHKMDFDLLLFQKQIFRDLVSGQPPNVISINAGATITLKQEDDSVIETIIINSLNYTQTYCDRILEHLSFEFIPTGSKVYLTIDIDNDGNIPQLSPLDMSSLFQSAEIDNIHLEVADTPRLALFYNDRGQRVRKESYTPFMSGADITYYVRDVAGSVMAIYNTPAGRPSFDTSVPREHPIYGASRLGVFYRDGKKGSYAYQMTDHLGNVRAVIMKNGTNALSLTSKTDYYPFGMAMPNRTTVGDYRYAFQGQEKDGETGMEAFELRLWDSRIGRWLSPDPMGIHHSPYQGMSNNPIIFIDPNGGYPTPAEAAVMAAYVYGDTNITLLGEWKLSQISDYNRDDKQSGLKSSLFERKLKDGRTEYAYVYAGTVASWADVENNVEQFWGSSEQYSQALEIADRLSVYLGNNELTFSGHSLGGGLANYSSLATGRLSIAFDPAWLSKSSIKKINTTIPLGYRPKIQQTNYISKGYSLHELQRRSAATVFVKSVGENVFMGDFMDHLNPKIWEVHSINNIIQNILSNFGDGKDDKAGCGCR